MRLVALEVEKADFGVYLFTVSIMAYFGLSQMGLDLAASQRIAESLARGDEVTANRIYHQLTWFNRGLYSVLAIAVAASVCFVLVSGFVDKPKLVAVIVALVGAGMGFRLISNPATAVLAGSQNVHLVGGITLANSLGSTFLAYVLLRGGAGILCLPAAQLIASVFALIALHALRRRYCTWSTEAAVDLWNGFTKLAQFALSVAACATLGMIDASSDPILFQFGSEFPLIDIATFNIWNRFPSLTLVVAASLLGSAGPTLASKMETSRTGGLSFHRNLLWLSGGIGVCATIGLCIWLVPFMHHWLSGTYDIQQGKITAIAMAGAIGFRALMSAMACVFYPLDRVSVVTNGYAILAITKIAAGIFFVQLMSPVAGMALANAFAALAAALYFAHALHRIADYSLHTLIGVFSMIGFAIIVGIPLSEMTLDTTLSSMVIGIAGTLVGLGIFYIILVSQLGIFSWRRLLPSSS